MEHLEYVLRHPKIDVVPLDMPERDKYDITRDWAYVLLEEYTYCWFDLASSSWYKIVVPAGLVYDGASVPRWAWSISDITPDGLIRAAALIHDWLYIWKGMLPRGSFFRWDGNGNWIDLYGAKWTKTQSDKIFSNIMRDAKMDDKKRARAYRGVTVGGLVAWYTGKIPATVEELLYVRE